MKNKDAKNTLGTIGLIIGFVALAAALFHFWAGPINPSYSQKDTASEKVVKIWDSAVAKLKGEKSTPAPQQISYDYDRILDIATIAAGFIAILFGVIAFVKREDTRMAGSAAVIGGAAIGFQYLVFALGVIFLAIIIGVVISQM